MTTDLGHRIGLMSIKVEDRNPERTQVGKVGNMSTATADAGAGDRGGEFECHTPTSDGNKIPIILICPPAPRKPTKKSGISCKRKLFDDDEFVETVKREEIEEFFRSNFELVARRRIIETKRCKCT